MNKFKVGDRVHWVLDTEVTAVVVEVFERAIRVQFYGQDKPDALIWDDSLFSLIEPEHETSNVELAIALVEDMTVEEFDDFLDWIREETTC